MKAWSALATTITLFFSCFRAEASELRVSIHEVASASGTLNVGLYDSEGHFQTAIANAGKLGLVTDRSRLVGIAMRAVAGTQSVVFTNLEPGAYAVIAFHDENDNGKLDKNLFGIPTEGYGFSNDAEGFLGPPSFKDAALMLDSHDREIAITLKYPQSRKEKRN
jgi:uncharacterized protein (DUF2141 family)